MLMILSGNKSILTNSGDRANLDLWPRTESSHTQIETKGKFSTMLLQGSIAPTASHCLLPSPTPMGPWGGH